jgi:2,4-dienoyl-CoA reductase-like NADH-dependent reductase (Old Yellow Enzyme family)
MTTPPTVSTPLELPCGTTLKHRLAKAAMTEGLADAHLQPTPELVRLYRRWAEGGAALLLTGNVQIDRRCLERPGNVALEPGDPRFDRGAFEAWAAAGTASGARLFMQISHAGRQVPRYVNPTPLAPSDSALDIPGGLFGAARAIEPGEIREMIARFAYAARIAKETGFSGVQIHGAHGYLVSEFLSPLVNRRTDEWGGPLENRARFLLEVVRAVRDQVGSDFPISVKLNSADFQRGGFAPEDCLEVARWLDAERIDLLEISGGTYEQPQMFARDGLEPAHGKRASTLAREAYFLEYARDLRRVVKAPLMVTGGFRSRAAMDAALAAGETDVIGLARPFCVEPDLPRRLLGAADAAAQRNEDGLRMGRGVFGENSSVDLIRAANVLGAQGWYCLQLIRMGRGAEPDTKQGVLSALVEYQLNELRTARRVRAARHSADG